MSSNMLNVKSNVQSIIWGYGEKMYVANSDEYCVMFMRNGQHVLEIWAAASQMSMSKWVQIRISEFDFDLHLNSLQHRWRCGGSSSQSLQQRKSFTNISLPASQIYHTAGRMNDLCGVAEIEIPQTGWMIASQNPDATNFLKLSGKEKICPKSHFVL